MHPDPNVFDTAGDVVPPSAAGLLPVELELSSKPFFILSMWNFSLLFPTYVKSKDLGY